MEKRIKLELVLKGQIAEDYADVHDDLVIEDFIVDKNPVFTNNKDVELNLIGE